MTVKEQIEGKKVKIESADKGTQVKRDELVHLLKSSDTWRTGLIVK